MRKFAEGSVYQIYPKSFNDTTGSGQGDINGVIEKLDYIAELGVEFIWLTPIYPSPMNDNGYDVADYITINPEFGTMEDFERLLEESKKRGLKVMLDMVFNHTSTDHKWFQRALAGEKKYQDYYIFKESENGKVPTNWISKFGGTAWGYAENLGKYYLHLFDKTQADLNWENPEVREEIYKITNFWLEKGVKGFRLDVINLISKPDLYMDDETGDGRRFYTDGPKIHEYLKELNEKTFGRYDDVVTVGEMSSTTIDNCIKYSSIREKELSMTFNFHHLKVDYKDGDKWSQIDFDFLKLKKLFSTWQTEMDAGGGWNALFWCNHDQPRIVSRFGEDKKYHRESATMFGTAIHMMKGTPYIYQGEEFGMTNAKYNSINMYRDVESLNYYKILKSEGKPEDEILEILGEKSRDNSRTPMQWNDTDNGGFTDGTPWLSPCENYKEINAKNAFLDKNSIFHHYKKLLKIRKEFPVVAYGTYEIIDMDNSQLYIYIRKYEGKEMLVICNFYKEEVNYNIDLDGYELLNSNYSEKSDKIRSYESRIYIK